MSVTRQVITQQIIQISIQFAGSHNRRILQLQCAGSRISRIGKKRLFTRFFLSIQLFKHLPWHKNFSTYLKRGRIIITMQYKRNRTDRFHIIRHIIPLFSITTGDGTNQLPIFISQRNRSTVIFHFTTNLEILIQCLTDTIIEVRHFRFRICICQ